MSDSREVTPDDVIREMASRYKEPEKPEAAAPPPQGDGKKKRQGKGRGDPVERARAYIAKIEPAIMGLYGSGPTFECACILAKGFLLSDDDARTLMGEYSQRCQPAWSDNEIEHKLDDAKKSPRPDGYLLNAHDRNRGHYDNPKVEIDFAKLFRGITRQAVDEVVPPAAPAAPTAPPAPPALPSINGHANGEAPTSLPAPPVAAPVPPIQPPHEDNDFDGDMRPLFRNFWEQEVPGPNGGTTTIVRGRAPQSIYRRLLRLTGDWPKRVAGVLFAERNSSHDPLWLKNPTELFAWVSGFLPGERSNQLHWAKGRELKSEKEFFDFLRQNAESYAALEVYPHWPAISGHWYMHRPLEGGDGAALNELLARFNPATEIDRHLIRAFFLTLFWGGGSGERPVWLFTAEDGEKDNGKGVGKSKIAQLGAALSGGYVSLNPNVPIESFYTRLLSDKATESRVVMLDNIKSFRFSWSELEALVTSDIISGKQNYVGEGQRPNTLNWVITFNGPSMSGDMSQRSVVVKIARPVYSPDWERKTRRLIEAKRWAIIGDIIAELSRPTDPSLLSLEYSRWGAWEGGVLVHVPDVEACQKTICARQSSTNDDGERAMLVREAFVDQLENWGYSPADDRYVVMTAQQAALIINRALGTRWDVSQAMKHTYALSIKELIRDRNKHGALCIWRGVKCHPKDVLERIPAHYGT